LDFVDDFPNGGRVPFALHLRDLQQFRHRYKSLQPTEFFQRNPLVEYAKLKSVSVKLLNLENEKFASAALSFLLFLLLLFSIIPDYED
jgi:hypothetical protein